MKLADFFAENPEVALGFSGGVDSAYLLYAVCQCGAKVHAYYVHTPFQPQFELDDAQRLAQQLQIDLQVLPFDVLLCEEVRQNPKDRCYYCKTALFGLLQRQAAQDGAPVLIDGTNASDQVDDRPGMRALKELSVRSPLRECGLTKAEIRRLSQQAGLFTWDKPAYACLATRIPSGQPITADLLRRVEGAESCLFQLGFRDFRARVKDNAAVLQIKPAQFADAMRKRTQILNGLAPFFDRVLLDMKPR